MVAVSLDHRLASKKIIELSDLYGETLMMVQEGDSGVNDFLRHDLVTNHPRIKIEDTPKFLICQFLIVALKLAICY